MRLYQVMPMDAAASSSGPMWPTSAWDATCARSRRLTSSTGRCKCVPCRQRLQR